MWILELGNSCDGVDKEHKPIKVIYNRVFKSFHTLKSSISAYEYVNIKKRLKLINYFTYFSTVVPSNICVFLSCRPFVVNTTFSTDILGAEVSSVS